jgi:hypothetical protein
MVALRSAKVNIVSNFYRRDVDHSSTSISKRLVCEKVMHRRAVDNFLIR